MKNTHNQRLSGANAGGNIGRAHKIIGTWFRLRVNAFKLIFCAVQKYFAWPGEVSDFYRAMSRKELQPLSQPRRTMAGLYWRLFLCLLCCCWYVASAHEVKDAGNASKPSSVSVRKTTKGDENASTKQKKILPNKTGKAKFVMFYHPDAPTNDELVERWNEITQRFPQEKQVGKLVTFQQYKCGKSKSTASQHFCDAAKQAGQAVMALVPKAAAVQEDVVSYPGLMRTDCIMNYLRQALRFSTAEALRKTRYAVQPQAERLQPEELENRIARFHQSSFFVMFYDDPRMVNLWDRMTLEFFGLEHKVTFVAVNCSYTLDDTGDVRHNAHKLCTEYAPDISLTFCTMHWFRAAKAVYKYEAPWTPYDLVKFVDIIGRDTKDIKQRLEPDDPARPEGVLREARDNVTGLYKEVKHDLDKRYAKNAIDYHEGVHDLTRHNFIEHITHSKAAEGSGGGGGAHLVFFYTPWDVWSHELSFALVETASKFVTDAEVYFDRVDCYRHGAACQEFNFTSYPQLMWMLSSGSKSPPQQQIRIPYPYNYHTFQELERFVRTMKRFVHAARDPHVITSSDLFADRISDADDFSERVLSGRTDSMYVLLYTETGCPACMDVMPYWEAAAHELQSHHMKHAFPRQLDRMLVARLNCGADEQNLEFCVENLHVNTFPTIVLYRNGLNNSNGRGSFNADEHVFGPINNQTASVHQLVQFALRSLGAYDVGAEHSSGPAKPQQRGRAEPEKAPEVAENAEKKLEVRKPEENVVENDQKLSVDEGKKLKVVEEKAEFSDSDLNMLKMLGDDFDVKIKDSDVAVVMLTRENCAMCDELRRPLNRLAFGFDFIPQMFTGAAVIGSVNCDQHANVCRRYGLKMDKDNGFKQPEVQLPSLHIFVNGRQVVKIRRHEDVQFVVDLLHLIPLPKMEI